ncbi:Bug family tripartite tricarboxylate transporter substrate binding protein [Paenalcaligenes hominis]|uniref:Bug family tripartite tricarboxylate transporter substrate binding protein n=1 Tax=Paenalcaligenes hominis TaxID=643674 RepID=UPI003523CD48
MYKTKNKQTWLAKALLMASCLIVTTNVMAKDPRRPECIAPSTPGGGFDTTCKFAQIGFKEAKLLRAPIRTTFMPGGIGAVAFNAITANRPAEGGTIVAFSSGSLLNMAQGKYGSKFDENDVRWLANVGVDYGMFVVRQDSPFENFEQLISQLKADPQSVVLGAGGTVGSQSWTQAALLARAAGIRPEDLRYVGFQGGGEPYTALEGKHIDVVPGRISDVLQQIEAGQFRVLAVLSETRLDGLLADIPTAKEQGFDLQWPVIRGFYMGANVSDEEFDWWKQRFQTLLDSEIAQKLYQQLGLYPLPLVGDDLTTFVNQQMAQYRELAEDLGLNVVQN